MVSSFNKQVKYRTAVFYTCLAIFVASFGVFHVAHASNIAEQLDFSTIAPNGGNGQGNMVSIGTGLSGACSSIQFKAKSAPGEAWSGAIYVSDTLQGTFNGFMSLVDSVIGTFTTSSVEDVGAGLTCTLDPSKYYYVEVFAFGTSAKIYGAASNTTSYSLITNAPTNQSGLAMPYFIFGDPFFVDKRTRIVYTQPYNNEATSSGSQSVGASIYVNADDYKPGMYLNVALTNQTVSVLGGSALDAWNAATGNAGIQIPITGPGPTFVGTSTLLHATGTVNAVWSIRSPTFLSSLPLGLGTFFTPDILSATSTSFIIGTSTPLDIALAQGGAGVANYLLTGTTTPELDFSACAIGGSFSVTGCMVSLVIPSPNAINLDLEQLRSGFASRVPWGYAYRLISIFTGNATAAALPTFTANIVVGSNAATSTESLTFDPGDMLAGGASLLDTVHGPDGHNLKDITLPWVQLFVALTVLIIIWHDIMAMGHHKKSGVSNSVGK